MRRIGFDPEFFVRDIKEDRIVPVCGKIGGTKSGPMLFTDAPPAYKYHEDNVVAELNVPPATNPEGADIILRRGMLLLDERLGEVGLSLVHGVAYHEFLREELNSPQAQRFGCDPDLDAYTGGMTRMVPTRVLGSRGRAAGGHIHLGFEPNCPPFVVAMFMDVLLPGYQFWSKFAPTPRINWYGKAGVFREKPYGIEYRTPDSRWLSSPAIREKVLEQTFTLMCYLEKSPATVIQSLYEKIQWINIQNALNNRQRTTNSDRPVALSQAIDWMRKGGAAL